MFVYTRKEDSELQIKKKKQQDNFDIKRKNRPTRVLDFSGIKQEWKT